MVVRLMGRVARADVRLFCRSAELDAVLNRQWVGASSVSVAGFLDAVTSDEVMPALGTAAAVVADVDACIARIDAAGVL